MKTHDIFVKSDKNNLALCFCLLYNRAKYYAEIKSSPSCSSLILDDVSLLVANMLIGYARVSTPDQTFELQTRALKKAGCKRIFRDTVSGSKSERPGLQEAMESLQEGDCLVVCNMDRVGRSLRHLLKTINDLKDRGVEFKSIQEAIDTSSPMGPFFFHITASFAEFEKNLIRERTKPALEAVRARGRKGGRKKIIQPEKFEIALKLYNEKNLSVGEICQNLGIKRRTFYSYLSEYNSKRE